jgi:hypothetical protein
MRTCVCLMSIFRIERLAHAIQPTSWCSSCVFMYVHVTHAQGEPGSYVDVPNTIIKLFKWIFSRVLATNWRRPGFDSRPGHVSLGTSSLGWRRPWSSLSILTSPLFSKINRLLDPSNYFLACVYSNSVQSVESFINEKMR